MTVGTGIHGTCTFFYSFSADCISSQGCHSVGCKHRGVSGLNESLPVVHMFRCSLIRGLYRCCAITSHQSSCLKLLINYLRHTITCSWYCWNSKKQKSWVVCLLTLLSFLSEGQAYIHSRSLPTTQFCWDYASVGGLDYGSTGTEFARTRLSFR